MLKPFIALIIGVLFTINASASSPDSLVTITSAQSFYQFVWDAKNNQPIIKQKLSTTYTSNDYQVNYPISELYNDHTTINDVSCKVDGHTPKNFKPGYTYYGEEDVFYSDARVCYFQMLFPKKGSSGTVEFDETLDDPRYFTNIYFAAGPPIHHMQVDIKIPRWMKVDIKELNFGSYHINKASRYSSSDDADIITYTIDNIPAMDQEPNSPGPTYLYPHLLMLCKSANFNGRQITYFNTLADQYAWYHELVKSIGTDESVIKEKAKELTTGQTSDMDKIKAIYYYVQNNIRYIAFEDGMAGFKPEKADEVLRKKYGDCKGMANLTKSLLVAAGYDARLCWLGTMHIAYDYQTPSMAVDNHMICALLYKDKTYYLDATETYIGFEEYAERIQGRQVLIEDGDKYVLNKVPYVSAAQNSEKESDEMSINGSSLTGKVSRTWSGEEKEDVLAGINSIKNEDADKAMKKFLSNGNDDYTISQLVMSSTGSREKDLTTSYDLTFNNAVSIFSKEMYIDLDNEKDLGDALIKIDKRKYDYWFPHKMYIDRETSLFIPTGYKVTAVPANLDIVNPGYEFHISYTTTSGKLVYKKSIILKNIAINKSKFPQWNQDIDQLNKAYNQTITLKPATE